MTTHQITIVVTRHPGLVALLRELGVLATPALHLEHVEDPSVLDGQHVAGVLPLHLAVRCASLTEATLRLRPEDRGAELNLEACRSRFVGLRRFAVRDADRLEALCAAAAALLADPQGGDGALDDALEVRRWVRRRRREAGVAVAFGEVAR